jgi:flagellar protein FliO/FliZ
MMLGLGVVLVAIAATVWLLRRLTPGQVGSASDLRVVAAVAVGPKERVVLVDVGEQRLVLGVAPGQVTKLSEMPRPVTEENVPAPMPPFVIKLKEMLAKRRSQL